MRGFRRIDCARPQCPLWVKSGHPAPQPFTSAIGVIADIGCLLFESEAFSHLRMSALGGKADSLTDPSACPLIAKSGHSQIEPWCRPIAETASQNHKKGMQFLDQGLCHPGQPIVLPFTASRGVSGESRQKHPVGHRCAVRASPCGRCAQLQPIEIPIAEPVR